jgi:cytochrome oxidase assembly protein ShyY1
VRNRVRNDNPGFEVIVPLRLDDGRVFIVDRGWLPIGAKQDTPDDIPAPPAGDVTVIARLQESEPALPGRTAPAGQVPAIHLPDVARQIGETDAYTGAYGLMTSEDPAVATRPAAAPKPVVDPGPFLSYAIQWIIFGVLAFVGLIWAYRRERRLHGLSAAEREALRQASRRERDADIEDAILDARD